MSCHNTSNMIWQMLWNVYATAGQLVSGKGYAEGFIKTSQIKLLHFHCKITYVRRNICLQIWIYKDSCTSQLLYLINYFMRECLTKKHLLAWEEIPWVIHMSPVEITHLHLKIKFGMIIWTAWTGWQNVVF